MSVFECFPYYNEIELLLIRLEEIGDLVDKFIIVEGTHTHQGDPKPLHLLESNRILESWRRKIVQLAVRLPAREEQSEETKWAWAGENIQRDYAYTWLKNNADPADIVIFSDADEIISRSAIQDFHNKVLAGKNGIHSVEQAYYAYYLNNKKVLWGDGEMQGWTNGIKIGTWYDFQDVAPNRIRYESYPEIPNGGWHFSSLGIPEGFQQKVRGYAHREFNKEWILEPTYITRQAQLGYDVYHGDKMYERCVIDDSYPKLVRENVDRYKELGWINDYKEPEVSCVLNKTSAKTPKVSIVIPTLNHVDDLLKPCIESLKKYTTMDDSIEIIVVANGCTDGTPEYMESLDLPVKMLWCDDALGFTKATNEGICASRGEFIVLLNNDTQILESEKDRWLNWLLEDFKDPQVGLTGPHAVYNQNYDFYFLVFFITAIRRSLFEELGLLDEIFTPGFGEDMDFCLRANRAGYKTSVIDVPGTPMEGSNKVVVGNYPIWHPADTTVEEIPGWDKIHRRNQLIVEERLESDWKYPKGQIKPYIQKYG